KKIQERKWRWCILFDWLVLSFPDEASSDLAVYE
ncbi:unnamed protein product, partial [marine sediment metagenome]